MNLMKHFRRNPQPAAVPPAGQPEAGEQAATAAEPGSAEYTPREVVWLLLIAANQSGPAAEQLADQLRWWLRERECRPVAAGIQ